MNYGAIKKHDVANGLGVRVSLFVSGCTHHCKECFNEEAWDFDYGKLFTKAAEEEIVEALKPDYIKGFSLLGGEPFEPANQEVLVGLLRRIKEKYPEKTIWCYSGYLFDTEMLAGKLGKPNITREMLSYIDVLVDGEFHIAEKNLNLRFRGSSNQRIIKVPEALKTGKIVLWDEEEEL
jgi:anaerobic ribonucleoside-triphosphate reductase activating protein